MAHLISRRTFLLGGGSLTILLAWSPRMSAFAQDEVVPSFGTPAPLPAIDGRPDGPLKVVTSTSILADLVGQVGGDRVQVTSILPANADPHDFEPSPNDVILLEEADLIVLHGLQLDTWTNGLIESAQTDAPVVIATTGIDTLGRDQEQEFSEGDPHVWFDPMRAKQMVATIRDGLIAADPNASDAYQQRYDAYAAQLDDLDAGIQQRIDLLPEEQRVLVTNHDALEYYADRYGLTIVGTVIPGLDSRTEPSAKEIAALIGTIQESGATVIFAENTVSPALAESLASDAGIRVAADLFTDSLGDEESGADTYIGLMQTDTIIIVENLLSE